MADEQTIGIPQLLLVLVIGGIAIRCFFFSGSSSRSSSISSVTNNARAREVDVERIQQMFPQIARRTIMWDLQRNGGNVAATTERILGGRGLENPPQTFQPPLPANASTPTSSANAKPATIKPTQPDLIARYHLASKIASNEVRSDGQESSSLARGKSAWSQNKNERQALLQKRREEMILTARRKMQERVAAETEQGGISEGQP